MQAQPATKESTAVAATALPAAAAAAGGSNDSVALWLYNKLHSPTHLWSFSSTVVSQYNLEKLNAIRDCFGSLDSIVKIKFFLTLFHVPKRNYEEFKPVVQEIIDTTLQTCLDQWVLSVATFVLPFWQTQSMSADVAYDLESFREAYNDLTKALKECAESDEGCERVKFLLPIEFGYLNKSVRQSLLPQVNNQHQSSLMALTSPSMTSAPVVNDILLHLVGGYESTAAAAAAAAAADYGANDSLENIATGVFASTDKAKKHFSLIVKSNKSSALDELKFKASHYSKSKTTKQLLSTTNTSASGMFGESGSSGNSDLHDLPTPTNGLSSNKTVPYVNRFMPSKKMESMTAFSSTSHDSSSPFGIRSGSTSSSTSNNTGSSSFFKRSTITSNTMSSTTITGKSSIKRDVGIKLLDVQEQSASPKEAKRKRKELEKETQKKLKQEQKLAEKLTKEKSVTVSAAAIVSDTVEKIDQDKPVEESGEPKTTAPVEEAPVETTANKQQLPTVPSNEFELSKFTTTTTTPVETSSNLVPNLMHGSLSEPPIQPLPPPPQAPQPAKIQFQPPVQLQLNQILTNNLQQQQQPPQPQQYQAPQPPPLPQMSMRLSDFFTASSGSTTNTNTLQQSQPFPLPPQQPQPQQQQQSSLNPAQQISFNPVQQQQQQQPPQQPAQAPPTNQHHHHHHQHHPPLHINQILQQQQQQQQQQQYQQQQQQYQQQQQFNPPAQFQPFTTGGAKNGMPMNMSTGGVGLGVGVGGQGLQQPLNTMTNISMMSNQAPLPPQPHMANIGSLQMPTASASSPSSSAANVRAAAANAAAAAATANRQQPSLTLTREQMLQAQEMFNNSNKLTRPEKALILGFIAGSRDNPRPEHGPLITIKLNEAEEILTTQNGQQHRVIGELYFQMNYETGEYKKIKKFKPLTN